MDFKQHIIIGIASVLALWLFLTNVLKKEVGLDILIPMLGVGAIFALMPDLDQPGSLVRKYLTYAAIAIAAVSLYSGKTTIAFVLLGFIAFITIVTHRTIIHSLLFGAIASAPFLWVHPFIALAAFTAFVSRLVADGEVSFFAEKDWW
ncbi:MAG: metal-dependent hydrolase [Candidatus Blackburnbacteria bacterium]|nr:metal-dependent hydrolase [Candidatus Blackburnbacteria bacterium]